MINSPLSSSSPVIMLGDVINSENQLKVGKRNFFKVILEN